jgi:uncharacterized membrane protein
MNEDARVRDFAITSMFVAMIFMLTFTPIGFIPLGPFNATIIHIPVIIGSLLMGPRIGALLGALFGLASFTRATYMPNVSSFLFSPLIADPLTGHGSAWAIVICFVPRILVGIIPFYVDKTLGRLVENRPKLRLVPAFAAGIAGSMTNTLLVLHLAYALFKDSYASIVNISAGAVYGAILLVILTNGVPEAIIAGVSAPAVKRALEAFRGRM